MPDKYTMSLDMRVLQHLGIRLYSNVAAVISELVANSWDADATEVRIEFRGDDQIVISDNGNGMSGDEINDRFLNVGYEKRKKEGDTSSRFKRDFMGRKGIGKLSVLSMAKIVDIYSSNNGEHNALRIDAAALEAEINKGLAYHPEEIPFDPEVAGEMGTTLVLSALVKKRTKVTSAALRKRLARRFSVFGRRGKDGDSFDVFIGGTPVDYNDRDDLRSLEFLWEFGEEILPAKSMPNLHTRYLIADTRIPGHADWQVRGWFGTARKPADLEPPDLQKEDDTGSMRNIVVLARGRLIQESILDKLGFNRIFGSYVTGLIEADFLDTLVEEDIATSDRQRLIEDDPRVVSLRIFMRKALLDASDVWTVSRRSKKADDAVKEHPALQRWLDDLSDGARPAAKSMLGLIGGLPLDAEREGDRGDLYRSGVLAFERLRLKEASHNLENLETLNAAQLLPLLVTQDHYESALYADIVRSRVESIRNFQHLTDAKAKEKVLQAHLFKNFWLLDAGWERVEGSETIEHCLARDFPDDFKKELNPAELAGRIDIKYRHTAGIHIIVELKKYEKRMKVEELQRQGGKYYSAMHKLAKQDGEPNPRIEVVFVLGQQVVEEFAGFPPDHATKVLAESNIRVVFYDEMIRKALAAYGEYLQADQKSDRIHKVLNAIGAPAVPTLPLQARVAKVVPLPPRAAERPLAYQQEREIEWQGYQVADDRLEEHEGPGRAMPVVKVLAPRGREPAKKNIPAKKRPGKKGKKSKKK